MSGFLILNMPLHILTTQFMRAFLGTLFERLQSERIVTLVLSILHRRHP